MAQAPSGAQQGDTGVAACSAAAQGQPNSQPTGSISGTVMDGAGAVAVGARVQLKHASQPQSQEVSSRENGQFSFTNCPLGAFQLTITAPDFKTEVFSGVLQPGTAYIVPEIALKVAAATTNVRVGVSAPAEVAQIEIRYEEQQRVLGIVPNFYVTYLHNAARLTTNQKFQLAWKSLSDPVTLLGVGALAGIQQAADDYPGFGQGPEGYAKRFGAAYATHFTGIFLSRAVLPSLLKQDPRYFYQGSGSARSRILQGLSYAVIRKGDNGRWQPNYSGFIGSVAAGGISYLYYPASDRSAGLLVQNALVGVAGQGVAGVFQGFVLRKFTSHSKNNRAHP